jgi:hypothetical protein
VPELHLFDFDGTLFRSPDRPPDWKGKGHWWNLSESLGQPCVPDNPDGSWWHGSSVSQAKQSISNPDVWAILCTGRKERSFARFRIPELLRSVGLNFDEVYLSNQTRTFKADVVRKLLRRYPDITKLQVWEDSDGHLQTLGKLAKEMGLQYEGHRISGQPHACVTVPGEERVANLASKFVRQMLARQRTPESQRFHTDEVNRDKHMRAAKRDFKALLTLLQPLADQAKAEFPDKDKLSLQRRGRLFNKAVKTAPAMTQFLDTWIGAEAQHPKAYSWRTAVIYQARDVLLYGKTMRDAQEEVEKQTFKGFEAITMSQAQAPLRDVVPSALREFLPTNIVVEVDKGGTISHITDRFENEHLTLGKKIDKMRRLVLSYNSIAKRVKKDFKNSNEVTKMASLITAIIMETGIRPGKAGNGVIKTVAGEQIEIETFGAITLGPAHVKFVRDKFATLEFLGKKGSKNTAEIADGAIIKVLQNYVSQALKKGSPYVFVTGKGVQFTYTDLQRYFRENFVDIAPTDFRKLRATEAVQAALREEQAALYAKIKKFAKGAKGDLKERIVEAIVDTFEAAIAKSQLALSHDSAKTTVKAYINPEIILRFLSTGRVDDNLGAAILGGDTKLSFDPKVFLDLAKGKRASSPLCSQLHRGSARTAALGEILVELRTDLERAGVKLAADTSVRLAERWVQGAGTAKDITDNIQGFSKAYNDLLELILQVDRRGQAGDDYSLRVDAQMPMINLRRHGLPLADGILSTRSIPPRQAKGMEVAYRLFYRWPRRLPKDILKWWEKNQKRLLLLIQAAGKWPEKQEGGDELFKLGPFTVHNTVRASGATLEAFKKMVEAAIKAVRKNAIPGFSKVLYGNLYLVGQLSKSQTAAWYNYQEDVVYCRLAGKKWGFNETHALIHELGHRYFGKFAKGLTKQEWMERHFEMKGKKVEVPMPEPGDVLPVRLKGAPRGWRPRMDRLEGGLIYYETLQGHEQFVEAYRIKQYLDQTKGVEMKFPTAYSAQSEEEHFCESLALLSMNSLPDEYAIPFKAIWN